MRGPGVVIAGATTNNNYYTTFTKLELPLVTNDNITKSYLINLVGKKLGVSLVAGFKDRRECGYFVCSKWFMKHQY